MGEPPSEVGGVKLMDALCTPATAVTFVQGPGNVSGVTALDGTDAGELPALFVATTVKVYSVPLVKPFTTTGEEAAVAVIPPGLEVTV